jgi:hypothetical protein
MTRGSAARLVLLTWLVGLFAFALALQPRTASAAINSQINFQGKLTNPDGTNVTNGTYSIVFSIYSVSTGGSSIWTETQSSVSITDGIFQVSLGSVTTTLATTVDFNSNPLYLGIKVGADAEMTPRVLFTATPYSFNSDKLDGLDSTNFIQLAPTIQTDSSIVNASIGINKTGATAKILDLQRSGVSVLQLYNDGTALFKNSTNSSTGFVVQRLDNAALLTIDTSGNEVLIGNATTDNININLQLDSYDTYADAATCTTTSNQGGMYYNTKSNAIRACLNGGWEDLASTAGFGMQLFGVVPDSGANPGDLASATGVQNGPCKVSVGATAATVSWTACTAYSGGRKVIVTAGTAAATNTVLGNFQHLCLTGTNGQPVLSTTGVETANLATVSMPSVTAPILCLADIRYAAANTTITQVYDTRTYTTTDKVPVSYNTAAGLGTIALYSTTKGAVVATAGANANNIAGVIVATTGVASSNTVNAIMAINGPASVKAITGTNIVNSYIFTSATAGYASTVAAKPAELTTTIYNLLGNARTTWSGATACAVNNDACAGSILTYIDKR